VLTIRPLRTADFINWVTPTSNGDVYDDYGNNDDYNEYTDNNKIIGTICLLIDEAVP
jgi:hypothetical protein